MSVSFDVPTNDDPIRLALDRHQLRRAQGVPTLSVLVGDAKAASQAWRDWAADHGPTQTARWPQAAAELSLFMGETILFMDNLSVGGEEERAQRLVEAVGHLSAALVSTPSDHAPTAWAIAVAAPDASSYLNSEAHTRAWALFSEGVVELHAVPEVDTALAGSSALLARHGVRESTAERFRQAAVVCRDAAAPGKAKEDEDRARSAAERFLFDLLDDLPATAGLFELNARLGFCFGPMRAEVDLLAASLRLTVEIDGYHHFREPENYRRDRRKDACLQKEGYLVLRFLAEDVVVRLEDVLEEILAAVAFRRVTR